MVVFGRGAADLQAVHRRDKPDHLGGPWATESSRYRGPSAAQILPRAEPARSMGALVWRGQSVIVTEPQARSKVPSRMPHCHAAGATQLGMQRVPWPPCPPPLAASCCVPRVRCARPRGDTGLQGAPLQPLSGARHGRGRNLLAGGPGPVLSTPGICSSAPAPIQPCTAGRAGSDPPEAFVQFSSLPPWCSLFPVLPCSPPVPDPASPDRHSSPLGQG